MLNNTEVNPLGNQPAIGISNLTEHSIHDWPSETLLFTKISQTSL